MSPSATRFTIGVPGDWIVIDPDVATRAEDVRRAVDDAVNDGTLPQQRHDEAVALIRRFGAWAVDAQVRFAAVLAAEDDGIPVVAVLMVSVVGIEQQSARPEQIDPGHGRSHGGDAAWFSQQVAGLQETARDEVLLPAGPAIRVERRLDQPVADGTAQSVYSLQHFFPLSGGDTALLVSGLSPAVRSAPQLRELFAEIASTVELH